MNKFINFHQIIKGNRDSKYSSLISNTDRAGTMGKHWRRIVHIHPKTEIFLFDSFGVKNLRNFIVQDNKKTIDKMLTGIENMNTW